MRPHYYLMKCKKILRLEVETTFDSLPSDIRKKVFDEVDIVALDQDQANWRVVIFRDEIMEYEEYRQWLSSDEALNYQDPDLDQIAN
jgi:hypothetical protein